jgi:hypothetical protein
LKQALCALRQSYDNKRRSNHPASAASAATPMPPEANCRHAGLELPGNCAAAGGFHANARKMIRCRIEKRHAA